MLTDLQLAKLMDMAAHQDKLQLREMLGNMTSEDVAYFKGYVAGYAEAVNHLQAAEVVEAPDDALQFHEGTET